MRICSRLVSPLVAVAAGVLLASLASAQQTDFTWTQCNGRSAKECDGFMNSLNVSPKKREETLLARAVLLLQGHDLPGAMAEYREVTLVNPQNALAYSNLGILEGFANDWPDAVHDLRQALALKPEETDLRPMVIVALAKAGDCPGAETELKETQAKAPMAPKLDEAEQLLQTLCP
jgi:Flp pilus assembly protein TadD